MSQQHRVTGGVEVVLQHTTTFFSLSDHDILSREWRVIVDQVQADNHGRPIALLDRDIS